MTATATPTQHWAALETALRNRRPVWITYHGRPRLICAHALGWHNGRALLLAYQTGGHTSTGHLDPDPRRRWRCLHLHQIDQLHAAPNDTAWATAPNYNPTRPFPLAIDQLAIAVGQQRVR